nr:DNA polymerase III subunit delta [Bacteroidota bacterium]
MLFKDVIGQDHIVGQLLQTIRENRISHAQLFFGGEGHGKLALAIAYAQFINCTDKYKFTTLDSCGVCKSCIKYNKLIHPDLHFIYPVAANKTIKEKPVSKMFIKQWREFLIGNNYYVSLSEWYEKIEIERKQAGINVHDCNEIIRTLNYTSYESEYKVMIIWMIEKLNYQAAPKLLKILEEPPDKTLFLLIAQQTDQIIPTILSRTQLVKIPKIEDKQLAEACATKLDMGNYDTQSILSLANGSFKEAVRMLQQSDQRKGQFEKFVTWMRLCWTPDIPKLMGFCDQIARESRENIKSFLLMGMSILRKCLVMNYTNDEVIVVRKEEEGFFSKFSPYIHNTNGHRFSEEFNNAIYHIERNANTGIVMLDLSLTVARLLKIKPENPAS